MKISPMIHDGIGGLAQVTIHFDGDDGEKNVREPISVVVEDKGGSELVTRAAYIKARAELPDSEIELYQLLTMAIYS